MGGVWIGREAWQQKKQTGLLDNWMDPATGVYTAPAYSSSETVFPLISILVVNSLIVVILIIIVAVPFLREPLSIHLHLITEICIALSFQIQEPPLSRFPRSITHKLVEQ
jgi:hypothetical protein